jgi:hypothetical protein
MSEEVSNRERYTRAVADLVEAFSYEDCEECGTGIDGHLISPDMFGHPHAWCKTQSADWMG